IPLAAAVAFAIALPAGAGKPDCDLDSATYTQSHPACGEDDPEPRPPAEEVACAFDPSGVLFSETNGDPIALGGENISYRCGLTAIPSDSFKFVIGTTDGATTLLQPLIVVTDAYPSGDMCFREFEVGRMTADDAGVFVTFSMNGLPLDWDEDGECDDYMGTSFVSDGSSDVYTLTFQTGKAKGGTVQLTMTDAPISPPTESG
ncbi:MAG: hypothetical protein MUQ27_09865, partial [Acidimicrobiia bacterium]|nr:hypothetical protein [Acidimicrobiia bacterium]